METTEWTYTTIDRAKWGLGPWDDEPFDKVQFVDAATGLPCLVRRHPSSGHWCGYVGVSSGHPFFEVGYNTCPQGCTPEDWCEHSPDCVLTAHGGINFSDACDDGPEATAICHVPVPGEADHVWWFGWDTAHYGDLSPAYSQYAAGNEVYRDLVYVREECSKLAAQLAAIGAIMVAQKDTTIQE